MGLQRIFISIMLLMPFLCDAQNWKTVQSNDTAYFSAGKHYFRKGGYYYPYSTSLVADTPLLRMMYIQNFTTAGTDTIFQFFSSFRDTSNESKCIDTASPSWLGRRFIRKLDGTEYYFNRRKDTITILTNATLGGTWRLGQDTGGKQYLAKVVQVGVKNIDGVLDSFKVISIQAYLGSSSVNNSYNLMVLELSKEHGWRKTLDFFRFPNRDSSNDRIGIADDGNQHLRLPAAFSKGRMEQNISWKYMPGNEWIWKWEGKFTYNPDNSPYYTTVIHDSVLFFQPLGSGSGIATLRTVQYDKSHIYTSGPTSSGYVDALTTSVKIHTDTVTDKAAPLLPKQIENNSYSGIPSRYFLQPYDSIRYFFSRTDLGFYLRNSTNDCYRFGYPLIDGGPDTHFETYLPDFGLTGKYAYEVFNTSTTSMVSKAEYGRYIYIKTGNTTFGTKVNVATLNVEEQRQAFISVLPNPADKFITIHIGISGNAQRTHVILYDIAGVVVFRQSIQDAILTIPTTSLRPGMYFLETITEGARIVKKVVIQH